MKKKILLLLLACLTLILASGCSWFDSAPVEPEIIGVGHVKFNSQNNLYVVELDSVSYIVDKVIEKDRSPRSASVTQELSPVDGMEVTVFRNKHGNVICVYGRKNEAQIEELYHANFTWIAVFVAIIGLFLLLSFAGTCYKSITANKENESKPQS